MGKYHCRRTLAHTSTFLECRGIGTYPTYRTESKCTEAMNCKVLVSGRQTLENAESDWVEWDLRFWGRMSWFCLPNLGNFRPDWSQSRAQSVDLLSQHVVLNFLCWASSSRRPECFTKCPWFSWQKDQRGCHTPSLHLRASREVCIAHSCFKARGVRKCPQRIKICKHVPAKC